MLQEPEDPSRLRPPCPCPLQILPSVASRPQPTGRTGAVNSANRRGTGGRLAGVAGNWITRCSGARRRGVQGRGGDVQGPRGVVFRGEAPLVGGGDGSKRLLISPAGGGPER